MARDDKHALSAHRFLALTCNGASKPTAPLTFGGLHAVYPSLPAHSACAAQQQSEHLPEKGYACTITNIRGPEAVLPIIHSDLVAVAKNINRESTRKAAGAPADMFLESQAKDPARAGQVTHLRPNSTAREAPTSAEIRATYENVQLQKENARAGKVLV